MLSTARTKQSIRTLTRRAEFLTERISQSEGDLSFDRRERIALQQAVGIMQEVLDKPHLWKEFYAKKDEVSD